MKRILLASLAAGMLNLQLYRHFIALHEDFTRKKSFKFNPNDWTRNLLGSVFRSEIPDHIIVRIYVFIRKYMRNIDLQRTTTTALINLEHHIVNAIKFSDPETRDANDDLNRDKNMILSMLDRFSRKTQPGTSLETSLDNNLDPYQARLCLLGAFVLTNGQPNRIWGIQSLNKQSFPDLVACICFGSIIDICVQEAGFILDHLGDSEPKTQAFTQKARYSQDCMYFANTMRHQFLQVPGVDIRRYLSMKPNDIGENINNLSFSIYCTNYVECSKLAITNYIEAIEDAVNCPRSKRKPEDEPLHAPFKKQRIT